MDLLKKREKRGSRIMDLLKKREKRGSQIMKISRYLLRLCEIDEFTQIYNNSYKNFQ